MDSRVLLCRIFEVVYLKLIKSLITSIMIQAQREFIAGRMQIPVLYFDNETKFAGLNKVLEKLGWEMNDSTNI